MSSARRQQQSRPGSRDGNTRCTAQAGTRRRRGHVCPRLDRRTPWPAPRRPIRPKSARATVERLDRDRTPERQSRRLAPAPRATRSAGIATTCFGCSTNACWSSRSADGVVRTSGVNGRGSAACRLTSTGTTSSPNRRQPRSSSRTTSVLLPAPAGPASSTTAPSLAAAPACSQRRCGCAAAKSAVVHFRTKYRTCSREPATDRPAESRSSTQDAVGSLRVRRREAEAPEPGAANR